MWEDGFDWRKQSHVRYFEKVTYTITASNEDHSGKFCFVTGEQIMTCGVDREKHTQAFIMENAFKITDESIKNLKKRPRKYIVYKMSFNQSEAH